jgi:hypothetical protein
LVILETKIVPTHVTVERPDPMSTTTTIPEPAAPPPHVAAPETPPMPFESTGTVVSTEPKPFTSGSTIESSDTVTPAGLITSGGTTDVIPAVALPDLAAFQPIQQEVAGEITEVAATGCYVKTPAGGSILLKYTKGMTDNYTPKVGDFWVVYANGYAFISPRDTFLTGHGMEADVGAPIPVDPNAEPAFPHFIRFVTGSPDMLETWIKNWVTWKAANPTASTSTKETEPPASAKIA